MDEATYPLLLVCVSGIISVLHMEHALIVLTALSVTLPAFHEHGVK